MTRRVVAQFEVATHPRWRPRDLSGTGRVDTLCNVFFSDVTRALGCEANHLEMGRDGKPYELDANNLVRWLAYSGPRHGWRSTLSSVEAGNAADLGLVVGVTWLNPEGIGHVFLGYNELAVDDQKLHFLGKGRFFLCKNRTGRGGCCGHRRLPGCIRCLGCCCRPDAAAKPVPCGLQPFLEP